MPELPEVETVRRVLKKSLVGKRIKDIDIRYNPIIENDTNSFKENVIGKEIIDIARYGKYLMFCLNKGFILSHLRMEGKYFYMKEKMDNKHIHVVFYFDDDSILYYQDVRKFGRMQYLDGDIYNIPPLSLMGPDLVLNNDISIIDLYNKIHKSNKTIKQLLLDQGIVAGLGNIYVDEVLYASHISPKKKGDKITKRNIEDIIKESKRILSKAIELKGTTIRSYTSSLGVIGGYQDFLQVHTKIVCPNCKMTLNRVKIEGRMTYYCKKCQR
ncbi:DNA-formamidopyrimidine glycosylase [Anaeroplasma bactoclasticum]|jgi:formamidopyrimidine-DNA glycosylase|nr:DNA-formamidopyrimidine glycosylase [Anaeroplasma bactoclasticum]